MENTLVDMMSNFIDLTEEEKKGILEAFPIETFEKGVDLIKADQIAKDAYLVIKGCVRKYRIADGDELTSDFFTEMQTVVNFESLSNQSPSRYYYTCLEDSVLGIINPEKERALYVKFPRFGEVCRVEMEKMLGENQEKLYNFKSSKPKERYLSLLKERPGLANRVPQYQLASYLGVKPETLSRIRKKLLFGS